MWFVDNDSIKTFDTSAITAPSNQSGSTPSSPSQSTHSATSSLPLLLLPPDLPPNSLSQQKEQGEELRDRVPVSHQWDPEESQVLAVEWAWQEQTRPSSSLRPSMSTTFAQVSKKKKDL